MSSSTQEQTPESVLQQIETMSLEQPALAPILKNFGLLQAAVAASRVTLPLPDLSNVSINEELLQQGVPILEHPDMPPLNFHLQDTAEILLPALQEAFPALKSEIDALGEVFSDEAFQQECTRLLAGDSSDSLTTLACQVCIRPEVLGLTLECLTRPALERYAMSLAPVLQEIPWNFWNCGKCPICGSTPTMSLLQPGPQEPSEFLKNSSAQRWLCCSSCAHTWRFSRTVCPFCGHDEKIDREYFHVQDRIEERVETCSKCNHYLLTVDIRDRISPVDHRLASLGLIHLEMLAQERGFLPLTDNPWDLAITSAPKTTSPRE